MRKRSSKGGGEQRSIQVHLMVNEEEAGMIRTAAKKRNQTVSLTIIEAVKLLEGRLQVKEEERDSPTVQALKEIEYQLRRIGRNVNQIAHNANREMNATIEDEASASYAVRQCREEGCGDRGLHRAAGGARRVHRALRRGGREDHGGQDV